MESIQEQEYSVAGPILQKFVCSKCDTELSDRIHYYNNGLCSHCGLLSKGSICDTRSVLYRKYYKRRKNWFENFFIFDFRSSIVKNFNS